MTHYYGVTGNREYFILEGVRRPYWEFLDRQPDGWLTSLLRTSATHTPKDNPEGRMIWDCGAWNYRKKEHPVFTAQQALDRYQQVVSPGAILIAPDHMLIEGVDLDARRRFNLQSAKDFIRLCPPTYKPMAAIHGQSLEERITAARALRKMGYEYLAVGGVAAIASRKPTVFSIVQTIRDEIGDAYLHVLGLSSPGFIQKFQELKIHSCDGSSHFYHAFKGSYLLTHPDRETSYLRFTAAKGKEPITAPICHCKACVTLRDHGVDIRRKGTSLNSLGRAAHNQNTIMRAQAAAMRKRIVLIACCGEKLPTRAPAQDLYQSSLFKKARQWAEANSDQWYILSAKHGLVTPTEVLDPYDQELPSTRSAREGWAQKVASQLSSHARTIDRVVVLAGRKYCDWIPRVSFPVERPMEGLGIGQQLNWLTTRSAS